MIEVYALRLTAKLKDDLFEHLLNFVDDAKQERIKRFRLWEDAHRTLYADLLSRHIIMNTLDVDNRDIFFSTNPYNKPFLNRFDHFHFNCAHSGEWIVCATDHSPIGVDIEEIKSIHLDISERFFSVEEHRVLELKNNLDRLSFFYTLWTLKESYLKAVGKGLYQSLNSFTIKFLEDGKIGLFLDGRMIPNIFFRMYPIDENYKLAVCASSYFFPGSVVRKEIKDIIDFFI